MGTMRRLPIVPVLLLMAGLTACTATLPPQPVQTLRSPVASPTSTAPTAQPTIRLDPVIRSEGHVIGTGAFTGPITGEVTVTPIDLDTISIRLSDLRFHGSSARQLLLSTAAGPTSTAADLTFSEGLLTTAVSQQIVATAPSVNEYMDLSDMHTLRVQADASSTTAIATARLQWTDPADLAALPVRDGGRRYGATGRLTRTAAGAPATYTVAKNDLLDNVAQRFDLTPDELLWLNPFRDRRDSGLLYVGETLNLDPASRK